MDNNLPRALEVLRKRLFDPLSSVRIRFEGDSITAGVGAPGHVVEYASQSFTAVEGQVEFPLNASLEGAETVEVLVNGVLASPSAYAKSGPALHLGSGVDSGTIVTINECPVFHSLLTRPGPPTSGSYVNRVRLGLIQATMGRYYPTLTSAAAETGTGRMSRGAYEVSVPCAVNPVSSGSVTVYTADGVPRDKNIYTSGSLKFGKALNLFQGDRARFKMVGRNLTFILTFLGTDPAQTFDVYVDGALAQSFAAEPAGFGYVKALSFSYGEHDIEVRNNSALEILRIESIEHTKLLQVINSGVSGTRGREWIPGGVNGVAVDTPGAPPAEFRIVALGTNDRNFASGEHRYSFFDNLEKIIDYHQSLGRYVIVLAHTFVSQAKDAPNSPYEIRMAEFVRDMRVVAERKNVDFIDAFSVMAAFELSKNPTTANINAEVAVSSVTDDGTHPNGVGHALIAGEVLRRMLHA